MKKTYNFILFDIIGNTSMSKEEIEKITQITLNQSYNNPSIKFYYNQLNPSEIELNFERKLDYAIKRNWIADDDMILLLGLPKQYFRPSDNRKPIVSGLIPWGNNYYIPEQEGCNLYKRFMKIAKYKIKDIKIMPDSEKLVVRIKF